MTRVRDQIGRQAEFVVSALVLARLCRKSDMPIQYDAGHIFDRTRLWLRTAVLWQCLPINPLSRMLGIKSG